jgi:threonine/homoserine/homoserine lactone efflux protein
MNLHLLGTFVATSLILLITPGPNLFVVLGRGVSQGRQAAIVAVLGFALGDVIHTAFLVIGISTPIESSILLFQVVKYFGSIYLIYLGVQTVICKQQFQLISRHTCIKLRDILYQSIISNVLNPSTALFFLIFFPQFVDMEARNVKLQMLILGAIFVVLGIAIYLPIAYSSGVFGRWICMHKSIASKVRWLAGSIFIGLGRVLKFWEPWICRV